MPIPPLPDTPKGEAPKTWHIQQFSGINTNASRPAIADNEFSWLQNYMPIGDGNMRTMWSNGSVIFTAPIGKTIVYYYFFNISTIQQCAVFLSDGTAVQVNPVTQATVTISSNANEFYAGGSLPAATQWNASGIIIVCESQNPNGYFAWDGSTLFRPGQNAPSWLTNQTATVMPSGIHGNAVETYQNRAWVTTPPSAGFPSIISQSGAGNGATFSVPAGGGSTPQQDSSLRATFVAVRQANGFLYYFGDSSIGVISNPQTSGGVTSYSNQNVDPQSGTIWPGSVQQFTTTIGVGIMFANPQGIYLIVGGIAQKVSSDLDTLFANADFATLIPTASCAVIFGVKVYCLLIRTKDQNGNFANVLCMTDGRVKEGGFRWFLGSQDRTLSMVATNEVNSILQTWGSDGTTLFQCFTTPSATLAKSIQTKFFPGGSPAEFILFKKLYRFYFVARDNAGSGIIFSGTFDSDFANTAMIINSLTAVNQQGNALQAQNIANQNLYPVTFGIIAAGSGAIQFTNSSGGVINFTNVSGGIIVFSVASLLVPMLDATCYGRFIGATLGSISADFTLVCLTMLYNYDAPYGG